MSTEQRDHQELLDFLYQCPTGLAAFLDDGTVTQINPAAVNLLVAAGLSPACANVYECLEPVWPDVRTTVGSTDRTGPIVEDHDIVGTREPRIVVGCTVVRLAGDRLMMVLTDATTRAEVEEQRAQLYLSEQQARRQLETLERSATRLVAATTAGDVADEITSVLHLSLGLDLTSVRVMRGGELAPVLGSGISEVLGPLTVDPLAQVDLPGPEAVAENRVIHVRTAEELRERYPDLVRAAAGVTAGSLVALPLRAADKSPIGSLVVAAPSEHAFDDHALALLNGIAGQAGLALERAALFDETVRARELEHAVALQLQRALLPSRVVEAPGVDIATRIRAASDLLTVGGDWYDSFAWPTGEVAVVVGDVVDHDVEAAAKMGRLRAGLSARSRDVRPSAAALLTELDRIARGADGVEFATAACVVIDTASGRVAYSTAGHPPPILVPPSGPATRLDAARSMPLGVVDGAARVEAEVVVEAGTTIVLYSDGLIERRGESLDVGIDLLARFVERHRGGDADTLAEACMAAAPELGNLDDDVLVAVLGWSGAAR